MVSDIMDEVLAIARAQGCEFPHTFKESTMQTMLKPSDVNSIMYQDFMGRRPMEIETYLGSPIKLAQAADIRVPRIETLYSILHNLNTINQSRPSSTTPPAMAPGAPPPRTSSAGFGGRPPMNGMPNGAPRGRGGPYRGPPPGPRRGSSMGNGYPPGPPNGYSRPPTNLARRPSFENNDLEEFSHVVLYDEIPEGDVAGGFAMGGGGGGGPSELALRERELALRQRELQLREQELGMRRPAARRQPSQRATFDDDDDDEDYLDPMNPRGPVPHIDPDNFDMMSVTSRRNRKAPSARDLRRNPEAAMGGGGGGGQGPRSASFLGPRGPPGRNRSSQHMMQDVPLPGESILNNPMAGYASNRYGTVDRKNMADDSRANSLTRERLAELQGAGMGVGGSQNGPYPAPRRTSISPGDPFGGPHGRRTSGRPSPPNGEGYPMGPPGSHGGYGGHSGHGGHGGPMPNGIPMNGRPGGPGQMRQPVPRHPPGQGNAVMPQQVEQQVGVSHHTKPLPPPKAPPPIQVRSLTGSASASAASGESALVDSENSAHSSQSSFAPRPPIGVR